MSGCRLVADGVYPRVCGGTRTPGDGRQIAPGLSPRVRGNPAAAPAAIADARSIPACAGEPATRKRITCSCRVYPRVCGGTGVIGSLYVAALGLSPRVRGNPPQTGSRVTSRGSIPACAGEPWQRSGDRHQYWVYPRVCGGTAATPSGRATARGLSPRVRGNHGKGPHRRYAPGSIPACAGEPASPGRWSPTSRVYPRVCGGTSQCLRQAWTEKGLSPRVRGNPRTISGWNGALRSIPACAGEPGYAPSGGFLL